MLSTCSCRQVDREELASAGSGSSGDSVVSQKPVPPFRDCVSADATRLDDPSHASAEVDMVSRM